VVGWSNPPIFPIKQAPDQNWKNLIYHQEDELVGMLVYFCLKKSAIRDAIKAQMRTITFFNNIPNPQRMIFTLLFKLTFGTAQIRAKRKTKSKWTTFPLTVKAGESVKAILYTKIFFPTALKDVVTGSSLVSVSLIICSDKGAKIWL